MKIRKIELIYFIAIVLINIRYLLSISSLFTINSALSDLLLIIAYLLLFVKIIYKESLKNLILYGIIIICALIGYMNCGLTTLITTIMIVIASKDIEIKRIVKIIFCIELTVIIIHMLIYFFSLILIPESMTFVYRGNEVRYNFFLGHPNNYGALVAWTSLMYFYIRYEKLNLFDYIIGILIAFFIYTVPNSRTSALLLIVMLVLIFFYKRNIRIVINLCRLAIPIMCVTIILLTITYNSNPYAIQLDSIFNSRLRLGAAVYENYGIHLFGEYIPFGEELTNSYQYGLTQLTTDSAYQTLIFCYGIINTFIFIGLYTILNFRKKTKNKELIFFVICALYAISESMALDPLICFPLLFATDFINKKIN